MLLKDKMAVIYGAGGAIGGAVARAFAREGARLFSPGASGTGRGGRRGRHRRRRRREVDALDEQAVEGHLQSVIDTAGRVDISFNAIGIPDGRSWASRWSSWTSSSSRCRSPPTRRRTS